MEESEGVTIIQEPVRPVHIPEEFFGRLAAPYGSREDRWLKFALKVGIVTLLLSFEAILIFTVAYTMWRIVHATP